MKPLRNLLIRLGDAIHPLTIVAIIVGLNVYWTVTLAMYGAQFQQLAGYLPIDLQNVDNILTPEQALAQIATYTPDVKTLYWSFFILDNIMPPLVFAAFALLWVYFLRRGANRLFDRLLDSPFLLIPLGVGFFDWFENLCYIVAISIYPASGAWQAMEIGLVLVRLKAACLFATFGVTLLLIVFHLYTMARGRLPRTQPRPA